MKKYVLMAMAFLIAASTAMGAVSEMPIGDGARIVVSMVNQEPDPAEPGNYVDARFKFENKGGGAAHDLEVELLPEYPFSLDPGRSAVQEIGSLYSRQMGDEGVIVKYKVKVDKDAIDGSHELKLRYKVGESAWVIIDDFEVDVQTHELILEVMDVVAEPEQIRPGEMSDISIMIGNIGNSLIKDIRATLDLGAKPLAPVGSTNEKALLYLEPGKNANIDFTLIAKGDAEADIYQVPLYLEYVDELGTKYSRNNTIGLTLGGAPDLEVVIDETTIYSAGSTGEVTIKFVNKGATDIRFLNMRLKESADYLIRSNEEEYLGNIDSDDYETAEFTLNVNGRDKKKVLLPVEIEYRDANNKGYSENIDLEIRLYSESEARDLGLKQGNNLVGIAVVVLIVAAGLFFYIRHRRKKKK